MTTKSHDATEIKQTVDKYITHILQVMENVPCKLYLDTTNGLLNSPLSILIQEKKHSLS